MASYRILLIDDHYQLIQGIQNSLKDDGYEIFTAANGLDGLKAARRHRPDLIILDINMPWMDGLEVCRRLREDNQLCRTPLLFLTSRNSVDDRVNGLDCGADDYLAKPFNTAELKARVRALLRRSQDCETQLQPTNTNSITAGPLTLDLKAGRVKVDDNEVIQLTPAEFELLQYRRNWGTTYLDYQDAAGKHRAIPIEWRDAQGGDVFIEVSNGRSYFRVAELTRLVELVEALRGVK